MAQTRVKWTSLNESRTVVISRYISWGERGEAFDTACKTQFRYIYLLDLQQPFHRAFALTNSRIRPRHDDRQSCEFVSFIFSFFIS